MGVTRRGSQGGSVTKVAGATAEHFACTIMVCRAGQAAATRTYEPRRVTATALLPATVLKPERDVRIWLATCRGLRAGVSP